jgi:glycosyltransferase 2 family protein
MINIVRTRVRPLMRSAWLRLTTRLVVGVGVLVAVIAHVGTGPLLHGLASLDGRTIGAALVLTAIATAAAAWRWRVIATRLGVELRWVAAVGMYYRSQFLNTVIPGGIVGDLHRAVALGGSTEGIRRTVRSVAIERTAGQVVQVALALIVVAYLGTEFEGYLLAALGIGLAIIVVALLVTIVVSVRARGALLREARELRAGLGSVRASVQVGIASVVVVGCHVGTLAIATAAVGTDVAALALLPLAFVILLGASIPLNVGGWGPREGIAGWAFALAGFGASAGIAASTLFGVLAIISVAPGAIVTVVLAARQRKANNAVPVLVLAATNQEKTS